MNNIQNSMDCITKFDDCSNQTSPFNDESVNHIHNMIFTSKQLRQRKKTTQYGDKLRGSTIYKYLKQKQKTFLNYKPRVQISSFSSEEDRILILLMNKLGPRFQKIARYFPGKTINMIKNRYYKHLRQTSGEIQTKIEEEVLKSNKSRIAGQKLINFWPENERMGSEVEGSPLFSEAKELLHTFLSSFQQLIGNCQIGSDFQ